MIVQELVATLGFELQGEGLAKFKEAAGEVLKESEHLGGVVKALVGGFLGVETALSGLTVWTAKETVETKRMADTMGLSVQALQGMQFAAKETGVSSEELGIGLRMLNNHIGNAAKGNKEAAQTFANLGISVFGTNGKLKPTEQVLGQVMDRLKNIPEASRRVNVAMELFGRSGSRLLPMLLGGREGLAKAREEAEKLGLVMSDELVESFEKAEKGVQGLEARSKGLRNTLAAGFLPTLNRLVEGLTKWYDANARVIRSMATEAARFFGSVLEGVVDVLAALVRGVADFLDLLPNWGKALLGLAVGFGGLALAIGLPAAGLVVLIALIAALIDDFEVWKRGGVSTIGAIAGRMAYLAARSKELRETLDGLKAFFHPFDTIGKLRATNQAQMRAEEGFQELQYKRRSAAAQAIINNNVTINGSTMDPEELRKTLEGMTAEQLQEHIDNLYTGAVPQSAVP